MASGDPNDLANHERRWELVGRVAELGASLEVWVGVLVSALVVGPDGEARKRVRTLTDGQSISWLVTKLRALAPMSGQHAALIDGFAVEVGEAMMRRNQIVHRVLIQPSEGTSAWPATPLMVRQARRGKTPVHFPAEAEEYLACIATLEALLARLHREIAPELDVRLSLPPSG